MKRTVFQCFLAVSVALGLGIAMRATGAETAGAGHEGAPAVAASEAGAAPHGEAQAEGPPELPNIFTLVQELLPEDSPVRRFLHTHFHKGWEFVFFSYLIVVAAYLTLAKGLSPRLREPGRFQGAVESLVEGVFNFFKEVMGEQNARDFVPLVGGLFFFIFIGNIIGIIPLFASPTSTVKTTFALSIPVFLIVQTVGILRCGVWGRIHHLMGSPKDAVGWVFAPLMFCLEVIGELVKPVSLGLRLFGNILGEDILIGAFAMMGVMLMGFLGAPKCPLGIPLQFPFLFLALLTSTIQALVFSLLASIYILLALPHEEHGEKEGHAHSHGG